MSQLTKRAPRRRVSVYATSDASGRRWALQFHYYPASVSRLPDSEHRLRAFGTDGVGVSCQALWEAP